MTTIKSAAVSAASKINAATRTRSARGRFEPVAPAASEALAAEALAAATTRVNGQNDRAAERVIAAEAQADRPKGRAWGRMRRDR